MPEVVLCKDGVEVGLESSQGLFVFLNDNSSNRRLGRFQIDASELLSTIEGNITYQATDGNGNSVRFEGSSGNLKIRLDTADGPSKLCRLEADLVRSALESLDISV